MGTKGQWLNAGFIFHLAPVFCQSIQQRSNVNPPLTAHGFSSVPTWLKPSSIISTTYFPSTLKHSLFIVTVIGLHEMEEKCFYFTSEKLCYHDVSETIQVIMDCRLQSEASKKCFQGATQFWSSNVGMMRFQGNSQMCKKVILSCVPANSGR